MRPVKIIVKYSISPKSTCCAEITVKIPCNTLSTELNSYYQSPDSSLFGQKLTKTWGSELGEIKFNDRIIKCRQLSQVVGAKSWKELNQQVERIISNTEDLLTSIYKENKKRLEKKPEDWGKIILPDEEED